MASQRSSTCKEWKHRRKRQDLHRASVFSDFQYDGAELERDGGALAGRCRVLPGADALRYLVPVSDDRAREQTHVKLLVAPTLVLGRASADAQGSAAPEAPVLVYTDRRGFVRRAARPFSPVSISRLLGPPRDIKFESRPQLVFKLSQFAASAQTQAEPYHAGARAGAGAHTREGRAVEFVGNRIALLDEHAACEALSRACAAAVTGQNSVDALPSLTSVPGQASEQPSGTTDAHDSTGSSRTNRRLMLDGRVSLQRFIPAVDLRTTGGGRGPLLGGPAPLDTGAHGASCDGQSDETCDDDESNRGCTYTDGITARMRAANMKTRSHCIAQMPPLPMPMPVATAPRGETETDQAAAETNAKWHASLTPPGLVRVLVRPRGGPPPSAWILSNKPRVPPQRLSKFAQAQHHNENECELDSEAQSMQWQHLGGRRQQMLLVQSWCTATSCAGHIPNDIAICRTGQGAVSWALAAAQDATNTTLTALRGTAVERAASKALLVLRQLERSIGTSVAAIVCDFVRQRGAPPTLTAERRAVLAGEAKRAAATLGLRKAVTASIDGFVRPPCLPSIEHGPERLWLVQIKALAWDSSKSLPYPRILRLLGPQAAEPESDKNEKESWAAQAAASSATNVRKGYNAGENALGHTIDGHITSAMQLRESELVRTANDAQVKKTQVMRTRSQQVAAEQKMKRSTPHVLCLACALLTTKAMREGAKSGMPCQWPKTQAQGKLTLMQAHTSAARLRGRGVLSSEDVASMHAGCRSNTGGMQNPHSSQSTRHSVSAVMHNGDDAAIIPFVPSSSSLKLTEWRRACDQCCAIHKVETDLACVSKRMLSFCTASDVTASNRLSSASRPQSAPMIWARSGGRSRRGAPGSATRTHGMLQTHDTTATAVSVHTSGQTALTICRLLVAFVSFVDAPKQLKDALSKEKCANDRWCLQYSFLGTTHTIPLRARSTVSSTTTADNTVTARANQSSIVDETSIGELRLHPFLAAATPLDAELDPISEREARVFAEMDAESSAALALTASESHTHSTSQCADDTVSKSSYEARIAQRRQGLCGMLSASISDKLGTAMLRTRTGDLSSGGSLRVQLMRSSGMSERKGNICVGADTQSCNMACVAIATFSMHDFSSPLVLKRELCVPLEASADAGPGAWNEHAYLRVVVGIQRQRVVSFSTAAAAAAASASSGRLEQRAPGIWTCVDGTVSLNMPPGSVAASWMFTDPLPEDWMLALKSHAPGITPDSRGNNNAAPLSHAHAAGHKGRYAQQGHKQRHPKRPRRRRRSHTQLHRGDDDKDNETSLWNVTTVLHSVIGLQRHVAQKDRWSVRTNVFGREVLHTALSPVRQGDELILNAKHQHMVCANLRNLGAWLQRPDHSLCFRIEPEGVKIGPASAVECHVRLSSLCSRRLVNGTFECTGAPCVLGSGCAAPRLTASVFMVHMRKAVGPAPVAHSLTKPVRIGNGVVLLPHANAVVQTCDQPQ